MSSVLSAALASGLVALAALGLRAARRAARSRAVEAPLKGVSYLLSGDPDAAIAILTRVAETGNLEAYFALGALFRRKGELDRAIQLHRNILISPGLVATQRTRGLLELGRDFRQGQLWAEAIETLAQAADQEASDTDVRAAREELRDAHLAVGDARAAALLQEKVAGTAHDPLAAHLWAQAALRDLERGDLASAADAAGAARRAAPLSAHGRFAELAVAWARGEHDATRELALDLASDSPSEAPAVLARLLEAEGKRGNWTRLGEALARRAQREVLPPSLALLEARLLRAAGDLEGAAERLESLLRRAPGLLPARQLLNEILLQTGRTSEMPAQVRALLSALGGMVPPRCRHCATPVPETAWRCQACGSFEWQTPP